jgi:hypothetical protein
MFSTDEVPPAYGIFHYVFKKGQKATGVSFSSELLRVELNHRPSALVGRSNRSITGLRHLFVFFKEELQLTSVLGD